MKNLKIAVLIDGDNANPFAIEKTLKEITAFGEIIIKRVYGDWSIPQLLSWKPIVNRHSIKTIQAFSYLKGKNSTDIALIIDAMDLLHENKVDAFCIISTDCDFTSLIHRIKENGLYTIVVGKENTCSSLRQACDSFILESNSVKEETELIKVDTRQVGQEKVTVYRIPNEPLPGLKIVGNIVLDEKKYG